MGGRTIPGRLGEIVGSETAFADCESWWPEYDESGDQRYRVCQIAYAARSVAGESLKEVVN